jgi:putative transposase
MSMAGALAYRPDASRARVLIHFHPGAYNDVSLIEVLKDLHRQLRGKLTLLWDGLPSHRSKRMEDYIRAQRRWLVVEPLPAYAPDLNPVEGMWSNLKGQEMANLCADTIEECVVAATAGIDRMRTDKTLAFAFLRQTGLSL